MATTKNWKWYSLLGLLVMAGMFVATVGGAEDGAVEKKPPPGKDWPQWRGPDRNGISVETGWKTAWPKEGPKQLWKVSVGQGFSGVAVVGDRVYTMGTDKGAETVFCLNADTGDIVWKQPCTAKPKAKADATPKPLPALRADPPQPPRRRRRGRRGGGMPRYPGPRATPTVDGKVVYAVSKAGQVVALDATSGQVKWTKSVSGGSWGVCGSPLVTDKLLILAAGKCGVALNKDDGEVVWKVASPSGAAYASPTPFAMGSVRCVAFMAGKEIVAAKIADGDVLWRHPWKPSFPNNCADPVFAGDKVLVSSAYRAGSSLLQFGADGVKPLWKNKEMNNHFASCVRVGKFFYGFDGDVRRSMELKCIDMKGAPKWSKSMMGSLIVADNKMVILTTKGQLVIAKVSPAGYKELARAKVLDGTCWTAPVLAGGRVYCRNQEGDLVCVDLRK